MSLASNAPNIAGQRFRESYFADDPSSMSRINLDVSATYQAALSRFAIYWSMYKNDLYRSIRRFAREYLRQYGLYRHTRGIYNPAARIARFWKTHLMGGTIDPAWGDGTDIPSAMPIDGATPAMRAALARLSWDSNWDTLRGVYTLWGPVFGEVGLRVIDDPRAECVSLSVVHPGTVKWYDEDVRGDMRAYVIEEVRPDPRGIREIIRNRINTTRNPVVYKETAEIVPGGVRYATYLGDGLFDWTMGPDGKPMGDRAGSQPTWIAPTPFIPMFMVKHIDNGTDRGESEFEVGRIKMDCINDIGSKLHDQIRRAEAGAWFYSGVPKPGTDPVKVPSPRADIIGSLPDQLPYGTVGRPAQDREEIPNFYSRDPQSRPWSLVGDLNIEHVSKEIRAAQDGLEDDYPELKFERLRTGGTISGEALRVARQPVSARVNQCRGPYDYAWTMASMAAIAIGGHNGYKGYEGFGLSFYDSAKPRYSLKSRPVFEVDPLDDVAEVQAKFTALKTGTDAGLPIQVAMRDLGWKDKDITEVVKLKDEAAAKAAQAAKDAAAIAPKVAAVKPKFGVITNGR